MYDTHLLSRMGYPNPLQQPLDPSFVTPTPPKYEILSKSLWHLLRACFDQTFDKDIRIHPNPVFQRQYVWDEEKKQALMISILTEQPIGNFYVNQFTSPEAIETIGGGYGSLLWDGKQRVGSIFEFLQDTFPLEIDGKIFYYSQIVPFFNKALANTTVSLYQSQYNTLEEIIQDYIIINKNQVKHTDADLAYAASFLENL